MLVNIAVAIGLIVFVASVSPFRQHAAPPTVSEFAPAGGRALNDVHASRPTPAATARGRHGPVALPKPKSARGVPPQLACYRWSDGLVTQTFDPQSPPCISRWAVAQGNGGATAAGVTATTVRIGVNRASLSALRRYAGWFNSHFELYGRTLQLVGLDLSDLASPESQQAAALEASQQRVFAVLLSPPPSSTVAAPPQQFLDTAADHGILVLLGRTTQASSTTLAALSPYAWSYAPGLDVLERAAGDLLCQLMAGRRAALSPDEANRTRRFGVVVPDAAHAGGDDFDVQSLESELEECHTPARVERFDPNSPTSAGEALQRLRLAGVTTIIPLLGPGPVARVLMPAAEGESYRPEWVLSGIDDDPAQALWSLAPQKQLRALAGLASWQPSPSASLQPASRAVSGTTDVAGYRSMLMLASGIQLAGTQLTPSSFANGLSGTAFPNPGAGRSPLYQAAVGFDDLDHAMVDDVALARWSPSRSGFCLADHGRRWTFGNLPQDPALLDLPRDCT